MKKKILVCFALLWLVPAGVFSGEKPFQPPVVIKNYAATAMGGIVRLTMEAGNTQVCRAAADKAFDLIRQLEKDLDHRNPEGSVGRINGGAGKKSVTVSPFACGMIQRSLLLGKMTSGIFDITIGAVTLEPLYYAKDIPARVQSLVDYTKVNLDVSAGKVGLPKAGMAIDLGGLAKGGVVDAAASVIRSNFIPRALVEAGGDLYCYGNKTWHIGIQDPRSKDLLGVIGVRNAGVCGSGDYYQYQEDPEDKLGRRHHILDPATLSSAHGTTGITVVAPTAELADALATALFIAGPKKGLDLLKRFPDVSALWVLDGGALVRSSGFPAFL